MINILPPDVVNSFGNFVSLTGATVTPNLNAGRNFLVDVASNHTLANPTNLRSGQTGDIVFSNATDTERTLSVGSYWKFAKATVPKLTKTSSTVISYKVVDATTIICGFVGEAK